MIDVSSVKHHPIMDELVDILCARTQNVDRNFFQATVAYFLGKVAASMRVSVNTKDRGNIPVNIYTIGLATSGFSKGYSVNILEQDIFNKFNKQFTRHTFNQIAEDNLYKLATENHIANNGATTVDEELDKLNADFNRSGHYVYTFDSGTAPAIKQLRTKLLMAKIGAINLQIDEIGSNLIGSTEILNLYLELYDQGLVKQKLTKNTNENTRSVEIDGKTPTNALMFGTAAKLLDGSATEDAFVSMLETGYARRCFYGWGTTNTDIPDINAEELFNKLAKAYKTPTMVKWQNRLEGLANPLKYGTIIDVPDEVSIKLLEYKLDCERRARELPEFEEIKKAELSHRYFKALKLAGAYAFIDEVEVMDEDHILSAIKVAEESGEAFDKIMTREPNYVKVAKFLADKDMPMTHADLNMALPFYKSTSTARNELMSLATAYGLKNNIIIKKTFIDGIELFDAESLKETSLDSLVLSVSPDVAYNYEGGTGSIKDIEHMVTQPDEQYTNFCNHTFKKNHRAEQNVIPEFNMIVLDIDKGTPLPFVHNLLKEYNFITYTTKRHTDEVNRFRLIMPIKYHLSLGEDEYKEFMSNIAQWLPFEIDEQANQRSRKWLTNPNAEVFHNETDELLDIVQFIPRTSKNEEFKNRNKQLISFDNLERWFAVRIATGNRNNQMIKFALALVDAGLSYKDIEERTLAFNNKLSNKLSDGEIKRTILSTVKTRMQNVH